MYDRPEGSAPLISQTAEYALRAVVDLAYHFGESRTNEQISKATKVPVGYLAKILQDLGRHDVVRSRRGLHGGFELIRDPARLTVFDVLQAVDPPRRIRTCPLGLAAHGTHLCPLHRRLDDAMAAAERAFRDTTIAEVTTGSNSRPLGGEPATRLTVSGGLALARPRRGRRSR